MKYSGIIVKPIYKNKGTTTDMDNYRPIGLLTFFAKIIKKIFLSRLNKFLVENNIICKNQHGFRKGHATNIVIYAMTHQITRALEGKTKVSAIMCDLT